MSDIPAQLGPNTLAELVTALNGPGGAKRRRSLAGIDSGRALADALTAAQPSVSDVAAFEEFVQTVRLFDGLPSGQDAIRGSVHRHCRVAGGRRHLIGADVDRRLPTGCHRHHEHPPAVGRSACWTLVPDRHRRSRLRRAPV